jgi:DNA modification methylase
MASIDTLKPDPRNARKRTERSATLIGESLKRYGAARSIVIDEDDRILAGNGTVEQARAAGITNVRIVETDGDEIIAVRRTGLTDQDKIGLAIADNRTSDLSEWDAEMLRQLDAEYDLTPWFFEDEIPVEELPPAEGLTDPDDVPDVPEEPLTKPGDLYILGNHRLLCGDSTDVKAVERLMDGQKADMVFTDPPYNVNVAGGAHDPRDKKNYRKGPTIENDSMGGKEFKQFLLDAFSLVAAVVKPGAAIYVAHADAEGINFRTALVEAGFLLKQCIIWAKQHFVFGRSDYHSQHEPILYGWLSGASHQFYGERNQGTVWNVDRHMRSDKEHPTQKPVALVLVALGNSSKTGDLLYEPFGGSGTTLIACEHLLRHCRMMELDPAYCDVIVKRWENYTGNTALLHREDGA